MATPTRVTQVVVETVDQAETPVRVTQAPVELITIVRTPVRVTQAPVEYLQRSLTPIRVTQMVVEIINATPDPDPPAVTGLTVDCEAETFILAGTSFTETTTVTVTREGVEVEVEIVSITPTQILFTLPGAVLSGTSIYCVSVTDDGSEPSTLCTSLTCPGCPAVLDPPPPDPPEPFACPPLSDDVLVAGVLTTNPPDSEDIVTSAGENIIVWTPAP